MGVMKCSLRAIFFMEVLQGGFEPRWAILAAVPLNPLTARF